MNLIAIALFIAITIIFIKYKPVCKVSISGEKLGYISNKNEFESKLEKFITDKQTVNTAFIDVAVPKYEFSFIPLKEETNEDEILSKIQEKTTITYKYYAVTIDNKQKHTINIIAANKRSYK